MKSFGDLRETDNRSPRLVPAVLFDAALQRWKCTTTSLRWEFGNIWSYELGRGRVSAQSYCTVGSASSGAPCRRNNCGRFCENAERGSTMSHPTSCAFCFRSPCTWDRKPMMDVPFFSLFLSLGMSVRGFTPALFR